MNQRSPCRHGYFLIARGNKKPSRGRQKGITMAQIHILDSGTIDKIAAGEVVERPSSVVKELVENAIDAGAGAVTVEIKDGGIEFIRVTDNGCGMEGSQIRRAFLRHATSKIEDACDLNRISSLGFRGEALSSIAAVAKVEVITKTADSITGSHIQLEGGKETGFDEVGAPEGTTFIMRNLFFNTPVRRKFLKQPATEGGYIVDLMEHLALSRPDISFKLVVGGQMRFHTSGSGDLKEVIYRIYGRDVANELVPVSAEQGGIRIDGYLGKPVQVRSNRNFEIYFLNGRFIRSKVICRGLEEGYKEYLMQHKFPLCVLHITMDPRRVDVNVHPTKMDVRFADAISFCNFVADTVRQTLRQKEMIPEASLSSEKELRQERKAEQKDRAGQAAPEPFEQRRKETYRVMEAAKYTAAQPETQNFSGNPVWNRVKNNDSVYSGTRTDQNDRKSDFSPEPKIEEKKTEAPSREDRAEPEEDFFVETSEFPEDTEAAPQPADIPARPVFPEVPETVKTVPAVPDTKVPEDFREAGEERPQPEKHAEDAPEEENRTIPEGKQLDFFEEKILTRDNRSRFRIIGQVFDTYWLVEFEDKLLMIDQHAAHEKVNYERLMKQYREKKVLSQGLLPPVIVSLSGQEETVLKECLDTFAALGFEIESFGGNEYALRSVPVDLYGCQEKEMFLEVLDALSMGTGFGGIRVIEEKIASMSCKAAVKGNHRFSVPEAEALIDELLTLDNPYHCPHGRPTIIAMTKTEMERKFKRIVS